MNSSQFEAKSRDLQGRIRELAKTQQTTWGT